jgi:hypothetical protein
MDTENGGIGSQRFADVVGVEINYMIPPMLSAG